MLHTNPYQWGSVDVPQELWVPCHRVVAKDGSLATRFGFGGLQEQKVRLMAEGVETVNNKVVMNVGNQQDVK